MNYKKLKKNKNTMEFAMVFALVFILLKLFFKQVSWIQQYSVFIAAFFLLAGIFYLKILSPLNFIWIKFSMLLGVVTNKVLLSAIFFLLLVPLAFLKKIVTGKKQYSESYWIKEKRTFTRHSLTDMF